MNVLSVVFVILAMVMMLFSFIKHSRVASDQSIGHFQLIEALDLADDLAKIAFVLAVLGVYSFNI